MALTRLAACGRGAREAGATMGIFGFERRVRPQASDFDFAGCTPADALSALDTGPRGLDEEEALHRLRLYGPNEPARRKKRTLIVQILSKFLNPLVIVLLIIAGFFIFFGEMVNALLVGLMAFISVLLSFIQEYRAGREAERLSEMVRATATVFRGGRPREILIREIVPGDVVDLFAGDMIPGDLRIIACKDLFLNEASLTGESFPVKKTADPVRPGTTSPSDLRNIAFMGSSVVSGTACGAVIRTGPATQFGEIAARLAAMRVETGFDSGVRRFTWLMIRAMACMVVFIFAINALRHGRWIESLLFSLGVAVGLTPEMLPMIVAINLSKGAIAMSRKKVIVKRLNSIQNFGAMDILCTDKTGTITMDRILLERHCDVLRREDDDVLRLAYINSYYQTGLKNLLDRAILAHQKLAVKQYRKVDEVPFDFFRKVMSVIVDMDGRHRLIAKGAPDAIFERCTHFELDGEVLDIGEMILTDLRIECDHLSADGFRVLAIAYKDMAAPRKVYSKDDERGLILKGYVAFLDPPKPSARRAIAVLKRLGVECKVLTGDNELVTRKICGAVGMDVKAMATGGDVEKMDDRELRERVKATTIFARLSPIQKERVIRALHANGHIVGYLGDGINDAPALKAADVGISVDNAVDIAKESADIILLKKSLMVLEDGVWQGRLTFGNIVKYIKMGSSSNFGNMLSMTGASLFLPFIPMLPIQILLLNFLYDLSQAAIPWDDVDKEYLLRPRPWNVGYIKNFMLVLGPISSVYDLLTYAVLLAWFNCANNPRLFHTGWFIESLCTQTLVIYVIRTAKAPFIESWPSGFLLATSLAIVAAGILIPLSPLAAPFGFVTPPASFFLVLAVLVASYLYLVQLAKVWFIRRFGYE